MALRETDITTGLYTPGFMIAFGARELSFARENGYPLSVIAISIVGPDESGVPIPDDIQTEDLKRLSDRVRIEAGKGSIVARMGTHDVAVLLPGVGLAKAADVAERIRKVISEFGRSSGIQEDAVVSIGVASTSPEHRDFSDLLKAARTNLEMGSAVE
jgi:two-component system cell cycle response regulator